MFITRPALRILVFVLAALLLGLPPLLYVRQDELQSKRHDGLQQVLQEANVHAATVVQARLRDFGLHTAALAGVLGAQPDFTRERLAALLREPGVSKYFTRMGLLWEDGQWDFNCAQGTTTEREKPCPDADIVSALRDLLPKLPEARPNFFTLPRSAKENAAQAVALAPVFHEGKLVATLAVSLSASALHVQGETRLHGGEYLTFLTDKNGNTLLTAGSPLQNGQQSLADYLQKADSVSRSAEAVVKDWAAGQSGFLDFSVGGGKHILAYTPVGDSGWYAVSLLLPNATGHNVAGYYWLWGIPALLFGAALLVFGLRMQGRAREALATERREAAQRFNALTRCMPGAYFQCDDDAGMTLLQTGENFYELTGYSRGEIRDIFGNSFLQMVHEGDRACLNSIMGGAGQCMRTEYRLLRKDGKALWVRDQRLRLADSNVPGSPWHCVVVNIDEVIRLTEGRQLESERASVLIDMAGSMLYDYAPEEGTVKTSKAMAELFDIANPPFIFDRPGLDTGCIHADDIDTYMIMRTRMLSGAASCEGTLRVRNSHATMQWYQLRMRAITDTHGRCAHIVGRLSDAYGTEDLPDLRQGAQHDALTGLLTAEGAKGRANAYMAHCEPDIYAALCLLDVPNFGQVLRELGGLPAEEMLTRMAEVLRRMFRPTDLLIRLDEARFAVLVKDMRDRQGLLHKLDKVISETAVEVSTGKGSMCAEVHMGVAFFPMQGRTFEQLHTYAEAALLSLQKEEGKLWAAYGND